MGDRITDFVSAVLFGRMIGDTAQEQKSPTYRYQKRQNKLIAQGGLLFVGFFALIVWGVSSRSLELGITVAFIAISTVTVRAIAAASDAIFDSLWERVNEQSAWLHVRLNEIEQNTSKDGHVMGQKRWEAYVKSMGQDEHYFSSPERYQSVNFQEATSEARGAAKDPN